MGETPSAFAAYRHIVMRVWPKAPAGVPGHTVLTVRGSAWPMWGDGIQDIVYDCGKCRTTLMVNVTIRDVPFRYLRCFECGAINEAPYQ